MTVTRKNASGSPRFRRGLSPWIMLGGIGLVIIVVLQSHPFKKTSDADSKSDEQPVAKAVVGTGLKTSPPAPTKEYSRRQAVQNNALVVSVTGWLRRIEGETDPVAQEQLMETFLASVDDTNIPAVLGVLQSAKSPEVAADLSQRIIRQWTKTNPQTAADWAEALSNGTMREQGMENVAIVWANSDLTNAINWAQSLADDSERTQAMTAVAGEAVRVQPVTALELAIKLPANAKRDDLVRRAAAEWAASDAPGAVAWAKQIPDVNLRAQVLASEAMIWASNDPQAAAEVAVNDLPEGRLQNDTVMTIVEHWAQQQPEAAAEWVDQFPEGKLKQDAEQYLTGLSNFQP